MARPPDDEREIQLKVTLTASRPTIWRRLVVRESMRLADLHLAIQLAMGWLDGHLYAFEIKGRRYTTLDVDPLEDDLDAEATTLQDVRLRRKGTKLSYRYDFGDDWHHSIEVEAVIRRGSTSPRPTLSSRRPSG